MTTKAEQLVEEARQLSPEEQEEIAIRLLDGIEASDETDEAWSREIERRVAEIRSGQAEMISGPEMLARVDAAVRGERRRVSPATP